MSPKPYHEWEMGPSVAKRWHTLHALRNTKNAWLKNERSLQQQQKRSNEGTTKAILFHLPFSPRYTCVQILLK